ncbi:MAG: translation initiation factor IF-2, partial [Bacteroidetes bacterium]|nr:translation initiation factor IF-2 [Bacteroidota bacterium]
MGKPIRLGKAAGELNVGIQTLVDFLQSKGIKIDMNPNTKLEGDQFDLLCQEFAADQNFKEQAKVSTRREKRETLSIDDIQITEQPQESEDEEETEINVEEIKRQIFSSSDLRSKSESKIQVVGKINLEAPDQKKGLEKKTEDTVKSEQGDSVFEENTLIQEQNTDQTQEETAVEIETIRFQRQALSGPTVLGKIELPVEKPKPPVATSAQAPYDTNAKRKRKRIKKVETNTTNQQTFNKFNKESKVEKQEISGQDIQKEIKETLARLSNQGSKSKASKNRRSKRDLVAQRRQEEIELAELEDKILKLTEFVTVSELAAMMNVAPTQVISVCMSLGIFASINQRLDAETIQIVADEFEFETQFVSAEVQESIQLVEDSEEDLISRPPIITVMGHVDHGKTSLLDKIRNANVSEGEAGGITQHIGAYSVTLKDGRKMTFLDTPGHEAFTAMRARGAQVTDVAIIIVAADDDVMPQTKEAISHAQAASVPMIFAINKIDKPGANVDRIKEQLSAMNILVEDWGGKYQSQEISAKQNINIDLLLDKVLLEAEILDLKANPNKNALGTVIESSLDKGKGYVTNMLVEAGTMRVGDVILVGRYYGRVRAMHDEHGVVLK